MGRLHLQNNPPKRRSVLFAFCGVSSLTPSRENCCTCGVQFADKRSMICCSTDAVELEGVSAPGLHCSPLLGPQATRTCWDIGRLKLECSRTPRVPNSLHLLVTAGLWSERCFSLRTSASPPKGFASGFSPNKHLKHVAIVLPLPLPHVFGFVVVRRSMAWS